MTQVSLNGVGTELARAGTVNLEDCETNPFSRVHSSGGYAKVNPWGALGLTEFAAPHSLNAWENYNQDEAPISGTDLEVTIGYAEMTISWVKDTLYQNDACRQILSIKSMGTSEVLSNNPFDSGTDTDVGDVVTYTINATGGDFYSIGLKAEFNDSNLVVVESADSLGCNYKSGQTPLLGAGRGISSGVQVYRTDPGPISQVRAGSPAASGCTSGDFVDVIISWDMNGPSTGRLEESKDDDVWTLVDSNVTAGSTGATLSRETTHNYKYRLRYNNITPDTWTTSSNTTIDCTQF